MNMAEHKYYNFKDGLTSKGKLVTLDELEKMNLTKNKDSYLSIYSYNDQHKKKYEETGSLSGIKDVTTNTLVWDFDSATDVEHARTDTVELAQRLCTNYNVDPDNIVCYFSSNKGFHVVLPLDHEVNPEQFKKATATIAHGLATYDPSVCDPQRILRLEHTKNPKSGLYKIPMHIEEVDTMNMDEIKELAVSPREDYEQDSQPVSLPKELFTVNLTKTLTSPLLSASVKFDPTSCPKGWKPYKWALAEGWFESGERHQALMVVAATSRALGYSKEHTYYLCKAALKKQAERFGGTEFDKAELWKNIIEDSVFADGWEGGSYSPATNPWLKKYCEKMGIDSEEKEEAPCLEMDLLVHTFVDYATNFEQNIIKTGITELDENIMFSTSTLNGILGQPGAGKTSWLLKYLRNTSKNAVPSLFISSDMGPPLIYGKLVQEVTGLNFKDSLHLFRTDAEKGAEISKTIAEKYKNVGFNFRSGLTVADIKDIHQRRTEMIGMSPKIIFIDYLECMAGPFSDSTANVGFIANQLKDLATELEVCIVLLLQTQKHSTPDIADPLMSMKQIKGSSVIEQACSTVLTLWREGYNPNHIKDDKYISFAVVKNRFGPQWQGDFRWEPVRGDIRSLTEEEQADLVEFKNRKKQAKAAERPQFE